ncbi:MULTISPECIES: serine hydrolase [unclassified Paenibacillus]|uniref:serine hydrolase n=1 Tax=unclassified Paenibacillus TaxID=185978 RepID=UPI0009A7783C|nr:MULTISPECIES: serine hydrolase [unclassified Paenibacillus]SLK03784.1 CubicO group peptidase, beta-lactamase class C family [Paenibacillus sp. RU5A]SOC69418.1 CubicO group peptidase, beta-lactamase class C family [Paenibacillus sp. RU26A]SOC71863.1 CubicO group peptidase, beta-lactamase class C family [Paenibacillus sp. RU5M]
MNTTYLHSLLNGLDDFVEEQLQRWKGVGVAVAVIHKDEVILQKGYGYRDLESQLEVTPHTLFAIGSSTKAFTASTAALLVDQDILKWDTPVRTYLKDFKMFDPVATERLTIRDMLCHRSGLPRHDMAWYNSSRSREELVNALQYLEPNEDFRNKWQYQNLMYMAAGYLVGQLKGTSWENVVQESLFNPLGMNSSVFSVDEMQNQPDFAFPYMDQNGENTRIPFRKIDAVGPAGSINSNLVDMIAWVQFQLNQGQQGGNQLISKEQLAVTHSPQMACDSPFHSKELPVSTYGLGWMIDSYRGNAMIHHGGAIDGFASQVAFLPEEQIGVVVLCNTNGSILPYTISFNVIDRLLELKPVDWSGRLAKLMTGDSTDSEAATDNIETPTTPETSVEEKPVEAQVHPHDRPIHAYAGSYNHPGYGEIVIQQTNDGLQATLNAIEMPMEYTGKDTFSVELVLFGLKITFTFKTDEEDTISSLSIPLLLEPGTNPIEFIKTPSV